MGIVWKRAVQRANKLARLLRRTWGRLRGKPVLPPPLTTVHTSEVPECPGVGNLYVVGEGLHRWYAVFSCPCGCGETVHLSLIEGDRPRWRLTEHEDDSVSLSPSVWRNRGCRSHFFVRRGRIQWCAHEE